MDLWRRFFRSRSRRQPEPGFEFVGPATGISNERAKLLQAFRGLAVTDPGTVKTLQDRQIGTSAALHTADKLVDIVIDAVKEDDEMFMRKMPEAKRLDLQVCFRKDIDTGIGYVQVDHLRFEYVRHYERGPCDMARGFWVLRLGEDAFTRV